MFFTMGCSAIRVLLVAPLGLLLLPGLAHAQRGGCMQRQQNGQSALRSQSYTLPQQSSLQTQPYALQQYLQQAAAQAQSNAFMSQVNGLAQLNGLQLQLYGLQQ